MARSKAASSMGVPGESAMNGRKRAEIMLPSVRTPTREQLCFRPDDGRRVHTRTRALNTGLSCCVEATVAETAPSERRYHQLLADSLWMADPALGATDLLAGCSVLVIIASIARSSETKLQRIRTTIAPIATIRSVSIVLGTPLS